MHPFELNPTFAFTLLGTFFIYIWTRPPRWTLVPILIIAVCTRILCIRMNGGLGDYYGVSWISWGAFLESGFLPFSLAWSCGRVRPQRNRICRLFIPDRSFPCWPWWTAIRFLSTYGFVQRRTTLFCWRLTVAWDFKRVSFSASSCFTIQQFAT